MQNTKSPEETVKEFKQKLEDAKRKLIKILIQEQCKKDNAAYKKALETMNV